VSHRVEQERVAGGGPDGFRVVAERRHQGGNERV
jgi:hypothetical protein